MRTIQAQIPNILSLSRVPLGIGFLLFYDTHNTQSYVIALSIALIAIITDFADGYLARRWNVVTMTGYFLDGIGDKSFYVAILLVMMRDRASGSVLIWLLIIREVALYALRSIDPNKLKNMERFRHLSLYYALIVRLFFLNFLIVGALIAWNIEEPYFLQYGEFLGYLAAAIGYLTIVNIMRELAAEI